jgi:hypothetical protein
MKAAEIDKLTREAAAFGKEFGVDAYVSIEEMDASGVVSGSSCAVAVNSASSSSSVTTVPADGRER